MDDRTDAATADAVGVIKISPIRGAVNPANVLTKFTFGSVFIKERKYIMGILHN